MHRLLDQPLGFGARHRRVEIRELLHGDVVAVDERDRLVLLPVALQPGFGRLDFLALLGEPRAQPVARLLRRREPVLEVLLDIVLRERVDDGGRERRVGKPELDIHQPAVADGRDRQPRREGIDGLRLGRRLVDGRRRTGHVSLTTRGGEPGAGVWRTGNGLRQGSLAWPAERWHVPEAELLERAARQRAALQHVVLGLVVVRLALILVDDLLEVDDVLLVGLDEEPRPGFVEGRRREGVHGHATEDEGERGERRPAPLVEHLDVVGQVPLRTGDQLGVRGGRPWRTRPLRRLAWRPRRRGSEVGSNFGSSGMGTFYRLSAV